MLGEVDGAYVVSCVAVLAALVFNYIAVGLFRCWCGGAGDVIDTGSFLAEEVDVVTRP